MRPLKLTMQAFGSYGKMDGPIDFTVPNQNFFLITGDTGAGKTTIFDAIVFALYGEAGSVHNRKDGKELQSQFVDCDIEPFVELEFSEQEGEEIKIYTVRRVPRHVRPLKRGNGVKEESEKITLIMPDGSCYPQKETNKKLQEIVGLTKSQFMQVAMIAQGEFMELLRAKSDDKKVIFRKLFNTELYQKIVDELFRRKKEKLTDIAKIRTICQTEAAHVILPDAYEKRESLEALKDRILSADSFNIGTMELFLDELNGLLKNLEEKKEKAEKEYNKTRKIRDERRDDYTGAVNILKSVEQLEKAEKELKECREKEEEIKQAADLITKIDRAYEIRGAFDRLSDAKKIFEDTQVKLKEQQDSLPRLKEEYETAITRRKEAGECREAQLKSYTQVEERVKKALETLEKIETARKDTALKEKAAEEAKALEEQAKKKLSDLENQEKKWKDTSVELEDAAILLERWKRKCEEAEGINADIEAFKNIEKDVASQEKKVHKARKDYERVREKYNDKNGEYLEKQEMFLDAQAGYIAREKLREGEPCPVCGSTEHPHPCTLSADSLNLTREIIDELAKEVSALGEKMQNAATASGSAAELLGEKENGRKEAMEKLFGRMKISISHTPKDFTLPLAEQCFTAYKQQLEAEGVTLQKNADTLAKVQKSLKGVEDKKQLLKNKAQEAAEKAAGANADLAGSKAALEGLKANRDYSTKEEALKAAEKSKEEKDRAYVSANEALDNAKQRKDKGEALIARYKTELPAQRKEWESREADYKKVLEEKGMEEAVWKEITKIHAKSEIALFQEKVDAYNRKMAGAKGAAESARISIGDRKRPVMEELETAKNEAEEKLSVAEKNLNRCREQFRVNSNAYHALAPKMKERGRIMEEYTVIDSLYNRLAGKVTGYRMDIETYVQRYYLQQILSAANMRFGRMSAGQFELRMVEGEQAGEGKNRGLDLMVYSTVTGSEREIRTLSGGESFMAALSLALGMADEIQEHSAAVNLDIMFIDEGFGSLDDHSRNQAVKVLKQMAGGSKLIGIISHVTELKQEIEDKLFVSKDEEGSHIKWQIS